MQVNKGIDPATYLLQKLRSNEYPSLPNANANANANDNTNTNTTTVLDNKHTLDVGKLNYPPLPTPREATMRLAVHGMTCASCVNTVENALKQLDGIQSASVNLLSESAQVIYNPRLITPDAVVEALESIGYETQVKWIEEKSSTLSNLNRVASITDIGEHKIQIPEGMVPVTIKLAIEGMTCSSCSNTIENHLRSLPNVRSAAINLVTHQGTVEYLYNPNAPPSVDGNLSPTTIAQEISSIGYEATVLREKPANHNHSAVSQEDEIKQAAERAVKRWRRLLLISLLFAVPVFFLAMIAPRITVLQDALMARVHNSLELMSLLMMILSTPIQFGVGATFIKSALLGLRHRTANMALLVTLGTLAAYFYALISFINALATVPSNSDMGMGDSGGHAHPPNPSDPAMPTPEPGTPASSSASSPFSTGGEHFFETSSTIITFVVLGKYLEHLAKAKTSQALSRLIGLQASMALVIQLDDNKRVIQENKVEIELLQPGDIVKVIRGEKVPADGVVILGDGTVDESMLTGEAMPVKKAIGSLAIGATVLQEGLLYVRVNKVGADTTLAQIVKLMEQTQTQKAPIQKYADKISGVFVPAVVTTSLVVFFIWFALVESAAIPEDWYHDDGSFLFSFLFAIAVLVIACPCALGLATPTAVMVGTGVGASLGILIKGGATLEKAHKINTVVFDKTGTLTKGEMSVAELALRKPSWNEQTSKCVPADNITSDASQSSCVNCNCNQSPLELSVPGEKLDSPVEHKVSATALAINPEAAIYYAASAERHSEHVIGKAIVRRAAELNITTVEPREFKAVSGRGLQCLVPRWAVPPSSSDAADTNNPPNQDVQVMVGNRAWLLENNIPIPREAHQELTEMENKGRTGLLLAVDGSLAALLGIADQIKPESEMVVKYLRSRGIEVWMATGDNPRTATYVANQIGITNILAGVAPSGKHQHVKKLQQQGKVVAMVGDGINDSPALAQADVGIAVASGTDIAIEAADIVLMRNDLKSLATAIDLSRVTFRRIKSNFLWAFLFNVLGIPIAAGILYPSFQVRLPPEIAALTMALSSVSVITSSLFLRLYRPPNVEAIARSSKDKPLHTATIAEAISSAAASISQGCGCNCNQSASYTALPLTDIEMAPVKAENEKQQDKLNRCQCKNCPCRKSSAITVTSVPPLA